MRARRSLPSLSTLVVWVAMQHHGKRGESITWTHHKEENGSSVCTHGRGKSPGAHAERIKKYSGCHLQLITLTSTHIISGNEHLVDRVRSAQSPVSTSGWAWKFEDRQGRSYMVQRAAAARRLGSGPGIFCTSCPCQWDLVSELHRALILSLFTKRR